MVVAAANPNSPHSARNTDILASCRYLAVVVPSDTDDLVDVARMIRVGGTAGDVKVTTWGTDGTDGSTVVIKNMQLGESLPIWVKRVWSTGTGATNILVGW